MKILAGIAILISIIAIIFSFKEKEQVNLKGMFSRVASSSTIVVGTQQNKTLFSANPSCSSRIISTKAQAIMLSFHSAIAPTSMDGNWQGASTTVAYSSDNYGCGAVSVFGVNASTTITITETTL